MIVADASAIIELLLRGEAGERIARRLLVPGQDLHAPALLDLEVVQVLRRYVRAHRLEEARAAEALLDYRDLAIERHFHEDLLPRIWDLRPNLTAYDAAYVALAEVLRAPLVTSDAKLAAVPGHRARIELL